MDEAGLLTDDILLGVETVNFIKTRPGEYLIARQRQDEADAVEVLIALNPYEYKTHGELLCAIAKAQESVNLSRKVNAYLQDAILSGNQAQGLFDNLEG